MRNHVLGVFDKVRYKRVVQPQKSDEVTFIHSAIIRILLSKKRKKERKKENDFHMRNLHICNMSFLSYV